MRLDKYLSELGIASRKELKEIIKSGRVCVNGNAVLVPEFKIIPDYDAVSLDGELLNWSEFRYYMMDKPVGVLTASTDKKQRTVIDLLPDDLKRIGLFPVGRLDKDTSGLLLLTNDGEFAHKVISPKYEIKKRYYAVTDGNPDEKDVEAFRRGIVLRDGLNCLPAELEILGNNRCIITVMEGKYHQVRRMLASVGKPVIELRRLSIGSLNLDEQLGAGNVVELSQKEIEDIFIVK
jgi:pseudouridine synthase